MSKIKDINFFDHHIPRLPYGEYQWDANQVLTGTGIPATYKPSVEQKLYVDGPRFSLNDSEVETVFPSPNGNGHYSANLPWVCLKQSTLPWERKPINSSSKSSIVAPWMALFVFNDDEMKGEGKKVREQDNVELNSVIHELNLGDLSAEPLYDGTENVSYITVEEELLKEILPPYEYLPYLSHCKVDESGKTVDNKEVAIIMANRLPTTGTKNTVYLVSLENRFYDDPKNGIGFSYASDKQNRFVYLHKWEFYCQSDVAYYVSSQAVQQLNKKGIDISKLESKLYNALSDFKTALANEKITGKDVNTCVKICKFDESFEAIVKHLDADFLNLSLSPDITSDNLKKEILKKGSVPLLQDFGSSKTISWYRGPLTSHPIEITALDSITPQLPQDLYVYESNSKMLDASYAAAFELGRMMCLSETKFALKFAQWKQQYVKEKLEQQKDPAVVQHLAQASVFSAPTDVSMSDGIFNAFKEWCLLKGVPYNYLIPYSETLPSETLRYFYMDKRWLTSFVKGAFQIGPDIQKLEYDINSFITSLDDYIPTMGCIIRSEAVIVWPKMLAEAKDSSGNNLEILRYERLAPDTLICLIKGEVKTFNLFLHPHHLEPGFIYEGGAKFGKELRDLSTGNLINPITSVDASFKVNDAKTCIDLETFLKDIKSHSGFSKISPAGFGMIMLEGVPKVEFEIN